MNELMDLMRRNPGVAAVAGVVAVVLLAIVVADSRRSGPSFGGGQSLGELFEQARQERHAEMLANLPSWVGPTLRAHPSVLEELGITEEHLAEWMQMDSLLLGLLGVQEERPQVPQVFCGRLLTTEDWDRALGLAGLPDDRRGTSLTRWSERCSVVLDDDLRVFARIQPGTAADFRSGARLLGVGGQPVPGIGERALWFGGADAAGGGELGVLAVRQRAIPGVIHLRVTVGLPDADDSVLLERASGLALAALPRFPGVRQPVPAPTPRPDPVVVEFEREPFDPSSGGLVDQLLGREAAGEWTRGEGLVAMLQLLAGERGASEVLGRSDAGDSSGTGVIALAREYLEQGADAGAREEIGRLLGRLTYSNEQLEAMAGASGATAARRDHLVSFGLNDDDDDADDPDAQADPEDACQAGYGLPGPCMEWMPSEQFPAHFRLFLPAEGGPQAGWTSDHVARVIEAMDEAGADYASMGAQVPRINFVLSMAEGVSTVAFSDVGPLYFGEPCAVVMFPILQSYTDAGRFKQWIAGEMAHCFIVNEWWVHETTVLDYDINGWWIYGLAIYWSNVSYPGANLEWVDLPGMLSAHELGTTLFARTVTNWLFFQHLYWGPGDAGMLEMIGGMPMNSRSAQEEYVAGYGGMEEWLHGYAKDFSDVRVADSGGGFVPVNPKAVEVGIGAPMLMLVHPIQFGVDRYHLIVADGKVACIEMQWDGVFDMSSRQGAPGSGGGGWGHLLPDRIKGEWVFVVTTVEEKVEITIDVVEVVEESEDENGDECECPEDDPDCDDPPPDPDLCLAVPEMRGGCPSSEYYNGANGADGNGNGDDEGDPDEFEPPEEPSENGAPRAIDAGQFGGSLGGIGGQAGKKAEE